MTSTLKNLSTWDWLSPASVDDALTLADYVDSLPETRSTFRVSEVDLSNQNYTERYLVLVDSWPIPSTMNGDGGNRGMRAVNPNYCHDPPGQVGTRCKCGAAIEHAFTGYEEESGQCNLDSCNVLWRTEASEDIWRQRDRIVRQSYRFLRSPDYVAHRLNVAEDSTSYICNKLNIERNKIVKTSQEELIPVLRRHKGDYTAAELARLLNRHESTVRRWW